MQHSSRISAFVVTFWRNWIIGVVLSLYGVLLADASVFRRDPRGHHLFVVAVGMFLVGAAVVLAAIVHAAWCAWRSKRPGNAA
jgi:hypothetical protein